MRISTAQFYETTAANYQKNFSNVVKSSEEASSLVRVNSAADDPVGASRLLQLGQQASMLAQYKANTNTVRATLGQAESVMTSITNVLQRAKELAIGANNAGYTDADRQANASELAKIEDQLLSLMNSKDENGKYIFAGSKGDTVPFSRNSDGTYSYNGDQVTLNLAVGDNMSMATNSTGWEVFQQAINTSRTQVTGSMNDGLVTLSDGQVNSSVKYNDKFRGGEPYMIEFVSATQLKITDGLGNDVTAEASQAGAITPSQNQTVSFRGVDLSLNFNDPAAPLTGRTFTLEGKPDTFNVSRGPGNPSPVQVTSTRVTDQAAYNASFPSGSAVLKFTSATTFDLYAAPITADSRPVSSGTMVGNTATASGVEFTLNDTVADPLQAGDQFNIAVNTHESQNILDTVSQLRTALNTPTNGDAVATQKQQAAMTAALGNLASGLDQVSSSISSVGGRGAALDTQSEANEALVQANTQTQSTIRDSDPAEVMTRLTLQQNMLQASQLAFSKIASLGLFNRL